jgi:pyridoxamine 5'-phosphate oxidase
MSGEPTWPPLEAEDLDPDPFAAFDAWWEEGVAVMDEPEALCVATTDDDGQPHARMVLLRERDERGFCFFTNYESDKGSQLASQPKAALLWYVEALGRQVRIEGDVERVSAEDSDRYFAARPRSRQISAQSSAQSQPIASRSDLAAKVDEVTARFEGTSVPRPAHWGGYRVVPRRFEFWQRQDDRLHDRVAYDRRPDGSWSRQRLQP